MMTSVLPHNSHDILMREVLTIEKSTGVIVCHRDIETPYWYR